MGSLKTCPDCGQSLPLDAFNRDRSRPDGRQFYCKGCYAARQKASYEKRRRALGKRVRADVSVPPGMKHCYDCGQTKPLEAFNKNRASSTGLVACCSECQKLRGKAYHLRKTYGLTRQELEALVASQGGLCAICQVNPAEHVDHCHDSGKIRGVLCFTCNVALGHLKDDVQLFRRAIDYLERTTWQRT